MTRGPAFPPVGRSSQRTEERAGAVAHHRPGILLAGAVGALVGAGLVGTHVLAGVPALLVLALAIALQPLHRSLSARILEGVIVVSFLAGLLWLLPLPGFPREAILAGVLGAGAAGNLSWSRLRGDLRRAVPIVGAPDVFATLIVPAVAAWNWAPYLFPASPAIAASVWGKEWDISSHSHIVWTMLRTDELLLYAPPAPDGSPVAFANYPATFHSIAASLIRLWRGASPLTGMDAVVTFNLAVGLLACLAAVIAATGVATLPAARRYPWWGCAGAGAAASVMLVGPGSIPLVNGHYNFQFAVALTLGLLALALVAQRAWSPRQVGVLACGIAVLSGTWLPLTAVAGIGALGVLWPMRAWRSAPRYRIVACLAIAAIALAYCLVQLAWTVGGTPSDAVNTPGGIERVLPLQTTGSVFALMLMMSGALAVLRASRSLQQDPGRERSAARVFAGALAITAFLAAAAAVALVQLYSFGEVRYYAMKMQSGAVDLAWSYLPGAALVLVSAVLPRKRPSTTRRSLIAALLAGTVGLGAWGVTGSESLLGPQQPQSAAWVQRAIGPRPELVKSLAIAETVPATQMVLVLTGNEQERNAMDSLMTAAARGTYSNDTNHWINSLFANRVASGIDMALANAERIRGGNVVVVAAPGLARTLRFAIPDAPRDAIRSYDP